MTSNKSPFNNKVTIVVYTLNEIDGMRLMMPQIKPEWCDELIVVDGHSTDGTIEYCREHGYKLYFQEKPSWTGAHIVAHQLAEGDIIVDFSPDGNSLPEAIPQLVAKIREGNDLVIASRYAKGARSLDDDWLTGFGNWMFTSIINLVFGARYTDSLVIFRAYRRGLIYDTFLDKEMKDSFTSLLCIRAVKLKRKIAEVPADEPKRVGGVRKMRILYCGWLIVEAIVSEFFDRRLNRIAKTEAAKLR